MKLFVLVYGMSRDCESADDRRESEFLSCLSGDEAHRTGSER